MKLGDINVNILQCLYQAVQDQNKDADALFASYGLDDLLDSHPDRRISIPRYMRLGEQAAQLTGRKDIGLMIGERCRSHHFGLMGLAAQTAPTLGKGLATAIQFERLYSTNSRGHSRVIKEKDRTGFCFYSISPYNRFNFFVVDAVIGGWMSLLKEWRGLSYSDLQRLGAEVEIEFQRPSYAKAYQRWQIPVRFSAEGNILWLPNTLCELASVCSNPVTYRQLKHLCQQQLENILRGKTLADQVREAIAMQLSGKTPSLEAIAGFFNQEPWTLRRKLEKENTSFAELLDSTRKELGTRYIQDTQLSIGEVAWLLGFSSSPAFQRAFKRWHQQAPGQFRAKQENKEIRK